MERFNAAASFAAKVACEAGVFSQPSIHGRCYQEIRARFGLSAQMAVRAIGKAVEAFARDKAKCPVFKPRGAVTYDPRILSFKGLDKVSLWTLAGRMVLPMIYDEYQGERFDRLKGQVDLVYRGGKFLLFATVDLPDKAPIEVKDFLGIDLGIVYIATDSDGRSSSGEPTERVRRRHHGNRARFQQRRSKGAKQRLRGLAGKETRFRRQENHVISKAIVAEAKDTGRGIALEDLKGIRDRTAVRAKQRARHSGWAFDQLRSFVEYKAKLAGVPVGRSIPGTAAAPVRSAANLLRRTGRLGTVSSVSTAATPRTLISTQPGTSGLGPHVNRPQNWWASRPNRKAAR